MQKKIAFNLDTVVSPVLQIRPCGDLPDLSDVKTLVFTSAHAVRTLADRTAARSFTCYTVGPGTFSCATKLGFDARDGGGTVRQMIARITQDNPGTPCLYVRGRHVAHDVVHSLNAAGLKTLDAVLYDQVECPLSDKARALITSGRPLVLPLFSPRSAQLLFGGYQIARAHVIAMSKAVAAQVPEDRAASLTIAARPDAPAMVREVCAFLERTKQLDGNRRAQ
ncbi:MAG: uroporphyrinogen-III synthase [Pseudomonadota bacterium]